jgi:hypothetical protein
LHKERLKIIDKETVEQWRSDVTGLDTEYKAETTRLANEIWIESRRLNPRTTCLGTDVRGNTYWLFASRRTVAREFGGFVTIQSPSPSLPTGEDPAKRETEEDEDDAYSDLPGWWYVDTAKDVRHLAKWVMSLAAKAAADKQERIAEAKALARMTGSPNGRGQRFAVEVVSPVKLKKVKGRKAVEDAGVVDTRVLVEELVHAAEWIEERY